MIGKQSLNPITPVIFSGKTMRQKKSVNIWSAAIEYLLFAPVPGGIMNCGAVSLANSGLVYPAVFLVIFSYVFLAWFHLKTRTVYVRSNREFLFFVSGIFFLIPAFISIQHYVYFGSLVTGGGEFPSDSTIKAVNMVFDSFISGISCGLVTIFWSQLIHIRYEK